MSTLDFTCMYLDYSIAFDATPARQAESIKAFLSRLEEYNLKLLPEKFHVGATTVDFRGHTLSSSGRQPDAKKVEALVKMPMPADVYQLRSLTGGLSYYRKFLSILSKRPKPLADLSKNHPSFGFTSDMNGMPREGSPPGT